MPNKAQKEKKNAHVKDLLLLLAVPIAIIAVAAAVIYIPRLAASPSYDFVYATCADYRCSSVYTVNSGRLTEKKQDATESYMRGPDPSLQYYDAKNASSRGISYEEAQKLRLNSSSKSPDGYTLSKENSNSGFLFWSDYDQNWYLKDGAKKKKVELSPDNSYYTDNITFLGWVEK